VTRLPPREADTTALAFIGKGRCFWPECLVKICAFEDGQYTFDCVRAHIEAAEPNGPRWNKHKSDEELRLPENLMWLCLKHHNIVDRNPGKYTVDVLKEWKSTREAADPSMKYIDGLSEQRLQEVIDESLERLVDELNGFGLPGIDVAEMLLAASGRMPGEDVASMLVQAGDRLPSEDVAGLLIHASERMPSADVVDLLVRASDRLPGEDVALLLIQASERMPSQDFLTDLDDRIRSLERVASDLRVPTATAPAAKNRDQLSQGQTNGQIKDAAWLFWAGLGSGLVLLLVGVVIGVWAARR
jgi:hypothetical protein